MIYRASKNDLSTPEHPKEKIEVNETALGEQLLSLISWAIAKNLDPEVALRKAALKYRDAMSEEESG